MRAQIAACRTGERRVSEIVERFGKDVFKAACAQIQDHGERLARAGLAKLPKGTWSAFDFMDDDGIDPDLVKMACTVTITDDEMVVDWTQSDPQVKGPINLPYGMTLALCSLIFKALTTPETPGHGGELPAAPGHRAGRQPDARDAARAHVHPLDRAVGGRGHHQGALAGHAGPRARLLGR